MSTLVANAEDRFSHDGAQIETAQCTIHVERQMNSQRKVST